jgi:hypothetical protein
MSYLTDATVEAACATLRKAINAAENSNHNGEVFVVAAAAGLAMKDALRGLNGILGRAESNASGNPEWEHVSKPINAARAALALAEGRSL